MTEETREQLDVLELDRKPREEKLRREQSYLGTAHEVAYRERHFIPHHEASIDQIRRRVDALEVRRRELPPIPAAPTPPPPPPAPSPPSLVDALTPVVPGRLVAAERLFRVGAGEVAEATIETDAGTRRALYLIVEGQARPYDDIVDRVDDLPPPRPPVTPAPPAAPPADAQPPSQPKKGLLGKLKKEKGASSPPDAPAPSEVPPKKGLLRKLGRKDAPSAPPTAEAPDAAPQKGLLGKLGRAAKEEAPPAEATSPDAPPAKEKKKGRFGFGRDRA